MTHEKKIKIKYLSSYTGEYYMKISDHNKLIKKELKEQANNNKNDLKLAYQCIRYRGVSECFNKTCLNMICPLNHKHEYFKSLQNKMHK